MSGGAKTVFISDHIRLGHDHVARLAHEQYLEDHELRDLVLWHHGYCIARRITWKTAAEEVGVDVQLLWRIWQGKGENGDDREFKKLVGSFRERLGKRNKCAFCETTYSKMIIEALEVAKFETSQLEGVDPREREPVIIHITGPSGCGKTYIARAWCAANNHGKSVLYEPKGVGGTRQLLNDLALINGVDRRQNAIWLAQRVFDCFYPGRVLIVDEVALLTKEKSVKQPMLDMLRRLADISGCALVCLATDTKFEDDLATGRWNDTQWWRRQARTINLPERCVDEDIESLFSFKFPSLDFNKDLALLLHDVNDHPKGGFGQVARVLKDAQMYAAREDRNTRIKDVVLCAMQKRDALRIIDARRHR